MIDKITSPCAAKGLSAQSRSQSLYLACVGRTLPCPAPNQEKGPGNEGAYTMGYLPSCHSKHLGANKVFLKNTMWHCLPKRQHPACLKPVWHWAACTLPRVSLAKMGKFKAKAVFIQNLKPKKKEYRVDFKLIYSVDFKLLRIKGTLRTKTALL